MNPDGVMGKRPRSGAAKHGIPLPVAGQARPERADAARNRRRILEAAEHIVAQRGVAGLAMDEVAAAAGVGVGTLYRRFEDRTGLALALLDEQERRLQEAFLYGPPPLGPGAEPALRLEAFLHAYADEMEANAELRLMSESAPGARFESPSHLARHAHVAALLRQACPGADTEYLADALLAALSADLYVAQRSRGMTPERIKAGLTRLIGGLTGAGPVRSG